MPRKLPIHVERNYVKGKSYYSFRQGKGPRTRLPDDPTTTEFMDAYKAALIGQPVELNKVMRAAAGTIAALISSYKQSSNYRELRATSKVNYDYRLEFIREQHGERSVEGLSPQRILKGILQPLADRPAAALDTLKKLRVLIRHAILIGWLKHDPSLGIKRPKIRRIRSWTEKEIAIFRAFWPLGTNQRTVFELFLNTGQRRSDVYRMAWSHITPGNKIRVVQQKTGMSLTIPLHGDLVAALDVAERRHVSILTTAYGRPFTVDGFSQWIRDAITAAGLPLECQPHGLRKAAGRRLAEAGATTKELMAILGHKSLAEAERYSEDAAQEVLADSAISRLEQHKVNGHSQTASDEFGETAKKERKSN